VKLKDVIAILAAEKLHVTDAHLELEIRTAATSDLMSDILARQQMPDLMLTGLATLQTIRTAAVASVKAVVIGRGKPVSPQIVDLARENDIPLMVTTLSLFVASGHLWMGGLRNEPEPS
jgi:predicted transcriptional regulator